MNFNYQTRYRVQPTDEIQKSRGPHPDYPKNLEIAKKFCEKNNHLTLPKGMMAKISGSQFLPESLLTISWKPPKEVHGGFFATPIFLHDLTREVTNKIDSVFKGYMQKISDIEAKNPLQPTLFDAGLTNMGQKV